jgi:hypothetical protein
MIEQALLEVIQLHVDAGHTKFSVAPCDTGGVYSSFYKTTVCREREEAALERYRGISAEIAAVANELFCRTPAGAELAGCVKDKRVDRWGSPVTLAAMSLSVAIPESGLREDVQTGRGRAGKPDDAGGQGRGPSNEACIAQIHPERLRHYGLTADQVLGREPERLKACLRVQMQMLVQARAYCAWRAKTTPWEWATVAMYGSGNSCTTSNHGKTSVRVGLFRKVLPELRAKVAKGRS